MVCSVFRSKGSCYMAQHVVLERHVLLCGSDLHQLGMETSVCLLPVDAGGRERKNHIFESFVWSGLPVGTSCKGGGVTRDCGRQKHCQLAGARWSTRRGCGTGHLFLPRNHHLDSSCVFGSFALGRGPRVAHTRTGPRLARGRSRIRCTSRDLSRQFSSAEFSLLTP